MSSSPLAHWLPPAIAGTGADTDIEGAVVHAGAGVSTADKSTTGIGAGAITGAVGMRSKAAGSCRTGAASGDE